MTARGLVAALAGMILVLAGGSASGADGSTATPIKYLVVIYQENVSFDHYFGTYPNALNPGGEPPFQAKPGTPQVNGLTPRLLTHNPNALNPNNGAGATNPFRLSRNQAATADQDHSYGPEQRAHDSGKMDLFPRETGAAGPPPGASPPLGTTGLVMGYYDGNTVTALWNYAQRFAMSDNSYCTGFGPSTPGAINLVSGQTNGVASVIHQSENYEIGDGYGGLTVINDAQPLGDVCSLPTRNQVRMSGRNIGDLLNAAGISWGAFMGGFNLSTVNPDGTTGCRRTSTSSITGGPTPDYITHHAWFQYYASTANLTHARPASPEAIGHSGDSANHQYDIDDFRAAVEAGHMPAVSFLKATAIFDGHAGYSDPLDEQTFLVNTINFLQQRPEWKNMAIVVTYDDSDGWYDHQASPRVNESNTIADGLPNHRSCGDGANALPGVAPATLHAQGRCGFGPRLPLLVISPWARRNFVDHTLTNQASVLRFIEDNWLHGTRIGQGSFDASSQPITNLFDFRTADAKPLILDPATGEAR
ncbi:MAG TPA: alkaline phosphatase family protein [Candidatus Binataceae bacterium]|nr:alkaline phosphatase family protein [Candidatus Binataceae bacterium]